MSRGLYRGVYSSLIDDPDFQALHPHAKLVFYTARLCKDSGPAAIFRYYPELLARQTGLTVREVTVRLTELEQGHWLYTEGSVMWIRNGLRHDPTTTLANQWHKKAVLKWLESLPHVALVAKFASYYGLPIPTPLAMPIGVEGHRDHRIPSPSPSPSPIDSKTESKPLSGAPPDHARDGARPIKAEALEVLAWLNAKAGKRFEAIPANLRFIEARLGEGREVWLLKKLVTVKAREWPKGHEQHQYLRPATLFNATKCAQYIGNLPMGDPDGSEGETR